MGGGDLSFQGLYNELAVDFESDHNEHKYDSEGEEDFIGREEGFFSLLLEVGLGLSKLEGGSTVHGDLVSG